MVSDTDHSRLIAYSLKTGDIVFSRVGSVDINALVEPESDGWLFSGRVLRVRSSEKYDSGFLHNLLETDDVRNDIRNRAVGQTMPSINTQILSATELTIPSSKREQQRIGNFFKGINQLLTLHQRKYEKLLNIKKSMLEKMFPKEGEVVPEIRFKGFTGAWEQRKAKDLFAAYSDKGHPDLDVLSATQDRGMVRRDDNNINISHDKKNEATYKRVLPGQFVIHLRSFQGGFAYSSIEGITSPAYTVFGFSKPQEHEPNFWKFVFSSEQFIKRLEKVTYGIRDGRSISYDEVLTLSFTFPGKNEQIQIAHFLDKVGALITLHQRK